MADELIVADQHLSVIRKGILGMNDGKQCVLEMVCE